jgi:hypothetical protein
VATFLASLALFGLVSLAMSVGVLVQGKRLRGSCGGTGKACECSALKARKCRLREMREMVDAT